MNRLLRAIFPPLVPLLFVIIAMELATRWNLVPPYLIASPSAIVRVMADKRHGADLMAAAWDTTRGASVGFAISTILGLIIALILSSARLIQRAFYPYAIFFQTVPIIAIAPLLVIWFGFDLKTVIVSATIASIFPVIANTLSGLLSVDPALLDLFNLYRASRIAQLLKLSLPAALPQVFTGLRIAAGLSVIGAVVGEFITGAGLGGLITVSQQQQRVDKVFAGIILASLLGLMMFLLVNLASWITLRRWHASEQK